MYLVELRKEIAYAFWISHWVGTGLTFVCRKWLLIIPVQWTRLSALFYVSMACLVTFRIGRIHMGSKGNVSFNRSCCHMRLLGILWPSVKLTGWLVVQCPAWIYIKCKWALPNVKWFVDPFEKKTACDCECIQRICNNSGRGKALQRGINSTLSFPKHGKQCSFSADMRPLVRVFQLHFDVQFLRSHWGSTNRSDPLHTPPDLRGWCWSAT